MEIKKNILGKTGIEVTELCLGTLPMGPLQKNVSLDEGGKIIAVALQSGITFIDTAQSYKSYYYIREGMRETGIRPVIATKSMAATYQQMEEAIHQALTELSIDYIDIVLLHAPRVGIELFNERDGALQALMDYKKRKIIRAIGVATHNVKLADLTAEHNEIDIIFPLFNRLGKVLIDGTIKEMAEAIRKNYNVGKGVYLMKVLGGGTMLKDFNLNIEFVKKEVPYHSIAIGAVNISEMKYNIEYFKGILNATELPESMIKPKVTQVVVSLCLGCGKCISACPAKAIQIINNKANINREICMQCGYCTDICPQFAIRII